MLLPIRTRVYLSIYRERGGVSTRALAFTQSIFGSFQKTTTYIPNTAPRGPYPGPSAGHVHES